MNVDQLAAAAHCFATLGNSSALNSLVVRYGVDLSRAWSVTGQTILHVGVIHNRAQVVRFGLEQGLSLDSKNRWGVSVRTIAGQLPATSAAKEVVVGEDFVCFLFSLISSSPFPFFFFFVFFFFFFFFVFMIMIIIIIFR